MKILIDADGCPVVDITVQMAKKYHIECFILCDTAHFFEKDGATLPWSIAFLPAILSLPKITVLLPCACPKMPS